MHAYLRSLALGLALLLPAVPAFAADAPAKTDAAIPDKPTRITERNTPVAVEYEGNDSIGSRLATRVKETLNSSNLFSLTDKDTPKIRILIATQPEFKDRPGVGSAYAVVWVFSQSENILRHYLTREVGVVTPDEINGLAAKLVEETDSLATRYGYLFQESEYTPGMSVITQAFSDAFQLLASGDEETFAAVQATLSTSGLAMLGCIIPGVPLGFLLGYTRFPGRNLLRILVDTALSFPTVVLGLLVYLLLARQGPFADFELLFTVPGIAIGLALLGLPIVIAHTCLAVEQADRLLAPTLRTLGAGPWQLLFSTVRELRFHLLTACITAFGRVVSEVGISMLVGGNIKWATRTITTAITLETGKGDYARSIALGIVLVTLAFALNMGLAALRRRMGP